MKRKNYIKIFLVCLSLIGLAGCGKDFLEQTPLDTLTMDSFYTSPADLRAATAPLYTQVWFIFNDKSNLSLGESRGGNMLSNNNYMPFYMFTANALNGDLASAWTAFYRVVAQTNFTINNIQQKAKNVTEDQKNAAIAEARFMRGSAYLYMVKLWGPVILLEDNVALVKNAQVAPSPVEDVYKFIIRDLSYASKYLPVKDDPGRVTKWAAEGMLSRAYLSHSGLNQPGTRLQTDLDSAKKYAGDVCHNSGLSLVSDYGELFKMKNNNNQESLFALQWVASSNWGSENTNQAYIAFESKLTGVGDGWGGGTSPSYDLIKEYNKDPNDTIRRNASIMLEGVHYPELLQKSGGYTFTSNSGGIKKYVIGTPDDNDGKVWFMSAPINTYMLRLAEVYLIYADAIRGNSASTTDPEALKYFNLVRTRANVASKTAISFDDMLHEVRVELAMESQYWYYLVNWYYYKPDEALKYINHQERGTSYTWTRKTGLVIGTPPAIVPKATASDMFLPYPESEVIQNPMLKDTPVPYKFTW